MSKYVTLTIVIVAVVALAIALSSIGQARGPLPPGVHSVVFNEPGFLPVEQYIAENSCVLAIEDSRGNSYSVREAAKGVPQTLTVMEPGETYTVACYPKRPWDLQPGWNLVGTTYAIDLTRLSENYPECAEINFYFWTGTSWLRWFSYGPDWISGGVYLFGPGAAWIKCTSN